MVSDGRATEDGVIFSDSVPKVFKLKSGALLGLAGDADTRSVVALFDRIGSKAPSHKQLVNLHTDFTAILALTNGQIWLIECGKKESNTEWYSEVLEFKDDFIAIGSGSSWAMGAMDRGASAAQAVKTAIKFHTECGGKTTVLKLEENLS